MQKTLERAGKQLINLLYPLRCASCGKDLDALAAYPVCATCKDSIRRAGLQPKDRTYAACIYEGSLKELIHAFKFKGKLSLLPFLAALMADTARDYSDITHGIDVMTFVPLHAATLREREFNQSQMLAGHLARHCNIELVDTLEKIKATRHQNELSKEDRQINLLGAFRPKNVESFRDRNVLLIDDVLTTGATLAECSGVLREAGAKSVRSFTLARGI